MQTSNHQNLVGFIWSIANKLRGPYRPPQYRRVMLPLIVLRRFDLVLAENKQKVLAEKKRLEEKGITGPALQKALSRIASKDRKQELFNTSGFTFEKLLGDAPNIAGNLIAYIQGFSPRARDIFDKFEFETEIAKLDEANRLFLIVREFCSPDIDLSPRGGVVGGDTGTLECQASALSYDNGRWDDTKYWGARVLEWRCSVDHAKRHEARGNW